MSVVQFPVDKITPPVIKRDKHYKDDLKKHVLRNGIKRPIVITDLSIKCDVLRSVDSAGQHFYETEIVEIYEVVREPEYIWACIQLKIKTVPVIVVDFTKDDRIKNLIKSFTETKAIYDKIMAFSDLVSVTTHNQAVLAHITELPERTINNFIEILKIDKAALEMLKIPNVAEAFTVGRLVEFAKKGIYQWLQRLFLVRLAEVGKSKISSVLYDLEEPINMETLEESIKNVCGDVKMTIKNTLQQKRKKYTNVLREISDIEDLAAKLSARLV